MLYDIIGSPGLLEKSEKGNRIAVSYLREECNNQEIHSAANAEIYPLIFHSKCDFFVFLQLCKKPKTKQKRSCHADFVP